MVKSSKLFFFLVILLNFSANSQAETISNAPISLFQEATKAVQDLGNFSTNCDTETVVEVDRTVKNGTLLDPNKQKFSISLVSEAYAQELFNKMASHKEIPFGYPEDGCFARAHVMSVLLDSEGITCGKVFVEGDLRVETTNSPKGFVSWWYHVAPIVLVEKDGKQEVYVIDPSIATKAIPEKDWIALQIKHKPNQNDVEYLTKRFNDYPSDKNYELDDYIRGSLESMNKILRKYLEIQKEREAKR